MNSNTKRFMWLTLALLPAIGQAAGYKFTTFQYPGAAAGTFFTGIDNSNRIVGYFNMPDNPQGFLITNAGSLATINVPGFVYAVPAAINSTYGVVGTGFDGANYGMIENGFNGLGAILPELPNQTVSSINSSGNIAGNFTSPSGAPAAYVRIRGAYHTLLPAHKCTSTQDPALNDDNTVVGSCVTPGGANVIFTWAKEKYTYIQTPTGIGFIKPTCINKSGAIAGLYDDSSGFAHGFVLNGATFTTVDYPGTGVANTIIQGMNDAGKLVGYYDAPGFSAFTATPQ